MATPGQSTFVCMSVLTIVVRRKPYASPFTFAMVRKLTVRAVILGITPCGGSATTRRLPNLTSCIVKVVGPVYKPRILHSPSLSFLPSSPPFITMTEALVEELKSLLTPFDRLDRTLKFGIARRKLVFPFDEYLKMHLDSMSLSELANFLVWIPFESFTGVEKKGYSAFGTVWKAALRGHNGKKDEIFALKEMDTSIFREVRANYSHWFFTFPQILLYESSHKYCFVKFGPTLSPLKKPASYLQLVLNAVLLCSNGFRSTLIGITCHPDNRNYLMVTKYGCAGSLEDALIHTAPNSWHDIFRQARDICAAVSSIHEVGVTHNNLHPSNFVLGAYESQDIHVIDIGIGQAVARSVASSSDENTEHQGIYGRVEYFPPETFKGVPYTKASDVYCVGTLMWQLVNRAPPRGTAGRISREDGLREDPVPGVPDAYQRIINDCWNLEPAKRPTMKKVLSQIQTLARSPLPLENNIISDETSMYVAERLKEYSTRQSGATKPVVASRSQYFTKAQLSVFTQTVDPATESIVKKLGACTPSSEHDLDEVRSKQTEVGIYAICAISLMVPVMAVYFSVLV
ncbi:kinase-like domain-containing protein [Jimgerdemannia flammicorona]|uniref:Kinase-like domain-containing protein n=1 Tax=Jimgerdemannia flammicorona TaxID=994334 RepID=A0A433QUK4_9FUNG|nr:kinase-like domain-containing protein [Jimgerdemannia flammicorona]